MFHQEHTWVVDTEDKGLSLKISYPVEGRVSAILVELSY
jgi:hypothetical protein